MNCHLLITSSRTDKGRDKKWKVEDELPKNTEEDLKKKGRQPQQNWKMTLTENEKHERRPKNKLIEDNLKHNFKKSTLIGCDIIVN